MGYTVNIKYIIKNGAIKKYAYRMRLLTPKDIHLLLHEVKAGILLNTTET